MNILITNDDGISSKGILALEKIFKQKHKTYLIAPLKEKSATSMALTIYDKMRVEKVLDDHYIVDGYPVDCVNIGIHGKIFPKIDFVLSGINRGVNMGYDVLYSGTVGAARHAAVHKIPCLAISYGDLMDGADYESVASLCLELISSKIAEFIPGTVYSLNFPPGFKKSLDQITPAKLGKRTYFDTYHSEQIIGSIFEFYLGGSELGHISEADTDFAVYYNGKIPLTPIHLDSTDTTLLEGMKI